MAEASSTADSYDGWNATGVQSRLGSDLRALEVASQRGDTAEAQRLTQLIEQTVRQGMADAESAIKADNKGDQETAIRFYQKVADAVGDEDLGASACLKVGQAYLDGDGVPQDHGAALTYLEGALKAGREEAHAGIGHIYLGDGNVAADYPKALGHLQRAAEAGDGRAHFDLANAYWLGRGVPQDFSAGARLAVIAVTSNDPKGQMGGMLMLATAYELGQGVPKDIAKSRHWYREISKLGADSREDLKRLKSADRANRPGLPILSSLLFIASSIVASLVWPELSGDRRLVVALILITVAHRPLLALVQRSGKNAQKRVAASFDEALKGTSSLARIGGVDWVVVDGGFHRLAHNAGERGQLYKQGTGRIERHTVELAIQHKRKRDPELLLLVVLGCAVALLFRPAVIWSGFVAAYCCLGGAWMLASEYLYRHGNQVLWGAMVLDPPPVRPGQAEVETQKVHGDARLTTEAEVHRAASEGGARRSSVHDQQF